MKKRILFCGEASWLSTGFAIYNKQIINRLFDTDKYTIAEFGNYGRTDEEQAKALRWKFYGNLPINQAEAEIYKKNPVNQFGVYKFDSIVADFQPDIIFSALDPWMLQHILKSQYRDLYKVVITPTVDSSPQKEEWVRDIYKQADVVTTYSRFGKRTLEGQGVQVAGVTSPAVDLELFSPTEDSNELRSDWGFKKGLKIIGTVMRNQKRKCFPQLFEAYAKLRRKYKNTREVKRSVLLCHTSWPDVGWDLPELLKRYNIQRHVIFTYKCDDCSKIFFSWFIPSEGKKGMGKCIFCGNMSAHMPNTHSGVSEKELSEIFNLMDIYVQPAICEGWGLPIVEAKACGVPGLYSDYSAMEDHVQNGGGMPIKIGQFYTEAETMAIRSLPDVDSMVEGFKLLLTDSKERKRLGKEARDVSEKMHNWNITSKKFEVILDKLEVHNRKDTWDKRPEFKVVNQNRMPDGLSNEQFLLACYRTILFREPDKEGFNNWMNSLANGTQRGAIEDFFRREEGSHNKFEEIRWNKSLEIRGFNISEGLMLESTALPGILI